MIDKSFPAVPFSRGKPLLRPMQMPPLVNRAATRKGMDPNKSHNLIIFSTRATYNGVHVGGCSRFAVRSANEYASDWIKWLHHRNRCRSWWPRISLRMYEEEMHATFVTKKHCFLCDVAPFCDVYVQANPS